MKDKALICECNCSEHLILFRRFENEPELYVSVHLTKKTFFKRIKHGLKYIFGFQSKYGAFDEVITSKEKVLEILNNLYNI